MNPAEIVQTANERLGASICSASTLVADRASGKPINSNSHISTRWPKVDAVLGGGLLRGALHEWYGVETARTESDSVSETDRRVDLPQWFAPVSILSHLANQALRRHPSRWIVWIGQRCFPYPAVLINHRQSDRQLLERSFFVRAESTNDRLHAIDLALRCTALEAVIADGSRFNMAATRRIQLLAKSHQKLALLTRPARERNQLSAAQSRWLVRWPPDSLHRTGCTPKPQWNVELLRCKAMPIGSATRSWTVEWDHATNAVCLSAPLAGSTDQTEATNGEAKHSNSQKQSA